MTDGAWQMLPNIQSAALHDPISKRDYLETIIDTAKMSQLFSDFEIATPNANEKDYRDFLMNTIISAINTTKRTVRTLFNTIQATYLPECSADLELESNKITFSTFTAWLHIQDKNLYDQFMLMLNRLEYVPAIMANALISDLLKKLNTDIDLGDDTLLTVQCINEVDNLDPPATQLTKCVLQ